MPVGQALDAGLEGAAFGFFPIMYIVFVAFWIYNMTVETGHFAVLRRAFNRVSDDQRVQAVIIAFSFGALLEALAGFGTPVAITAVMLIALGFKPIKAASVALVANTAPVAFGAIAIPIVTLAQVTGLPQDDLGAMVGRQTPLLALIVPLILVGMVDGTRGIRQAWPAAVVGGLTFAVGAVRLLELHLGRAHRHRRLAAVRRLDRRARAGLAARASRCAARPARRTRPAIAGAAVADAAHRGRGPAQGGRRRATPTREIAAAFAPYLFIIVVFALAQYGPIKDCLDGRRARVPVARPRRPQRQGRGADVAHLQVRLAQRGGHAAADRRPADDARRCASAPGARCGSSGARSYELRWATLTVATVLALAYVMNLSGQTITLGTWIAGAGGVLGVPVRDHRLARRRGDRLGHVVELAVRHAAGGGRAEGRLLADAARRGQLLGRRAREDDLAAEPRDRRGRGRHGRPGGRALPQGARMEHPVDPRSCA